MRLRRLRVKAVCGQDRRGVALGMFRYGDKQKGAVDFFPARPHGVLERAGKEVVELVAEGRSRAAGGNQRRIIVYRGDHRALDDRDIRVHGLQQLDGVRVVEQRQQQVLQRDIAMRAAAGPRSRRGAMYDPNRRNAAVPRALRNESFIISLAFGARLLANAASATIGATDVF